MAKKRLRWYLGSVSAMPRITWELLWELFRCSYQPTERSHGHLYGVVWGPFRTKQGALFAQMYGQGNPHIQTVDDAERLAKRYKGQTEF
jgi:hypothetical protein